ncbi:catabolic alanine racemase DadX [Pantoea sp. Nvir]|uniref:catabolic alanine racemase DadX n=1 Tax=Pantoea sp. Nvir TaxID=2576760 RepID=UPI00135CBCEB|nr:catabolic alanine racemase DadX [Pantoea sp. Nvir]MXP66682.1 catabolic alanine racemase DadX [Pantoea sp. Nvir]CAJ0991858.1 Alanine racemase, catabolic [Pantoea sp. Nvir]
MPRPVLATIDQQALQHNLTIVRKTAPNSRVWSVVKANAYGHGLTRVWKSLEQTDGFAVLNMEEAILLRDLGWQKPILLLEGFFHTADLTLIDRYRLTTSVHSNWQIKALEEAHLCSPVNIYLKVNSGINRLGFSPEQAYTMYQKLHSLPSVGDITLMSHLADAENPKGLIEPLQRIERAGKALAIPRSLSNSACTLWHPEAHYNWVRPGIILYGASPSGDWKNIANTGLKPVMTLVSEIIGNQQLAPGDGVGYGYRYRAQHAQRIGVVACGYADGYPRHAPNGTPVCIDGVRTQVIGAISMDMMTVDLTPCPHARIGSKVELWGTQVKIDEVAKAAGTVGYELMCALAPRVPVTLI